MGVGIQVNDFFDFQELCRELDHHNGRRNHSPGSLLGRFMVPLDSGQLGAMHNQIMRESPAYRDRCRLNRCIGYVCMLAALINFISSTILSIDTPVFAIPAVFLTLGCCGAGFSIRDRGIIEEAQYQNDILNSFNRVITYANQRPDRSDTIQNWYSQFTMAAGTA